MVCFIFGEKQPGVVFAIEIADSEFVIAGLTGVWRLDPSKSDALRGPGGPGGVRPPGMGEGGHHSPDAYGGHGGQGGHGGPDGGGGMRRGLPRFLRIAPVDVGLSIADSAGTVVQEIALRPESGDADGSGDGPPVLPGQWKGDRLEVKRTTPRGTMTQTFALSDKGQSLVVSTKVEPSGGRPGFENKRVYRRAAAS